MGGNIESTAVVLIAGCRRLADALRLCTNLRGSHLATLRQIRFRSVSTRAQLLDDFRHCWYIGLAFLTKNNYDSLILLSLSDGLAVLQCDRMTV